MSTKVTLPELEKIAELLSDIIAKDVQVSQATTAPAGEGKVTAVYRDDQGQPLSCCICELPLAAFLGAALVRMPAAAAKDAIAAGTLPENLRDNLFEVLNIAAQLFRPRAARHRVSLSALHLAAEPLGGELSSALASPASRVDVEVSIPGYEAGKMTLATLEQAPA